MGSKTKEKPETEVTLAHGEKSITMSGEEFDRATGEILGGQLSLFEGHRVQMIQNAVKGGEVVIFNEDGTGFKDVIKFGEKIRIAATAEVVKVTHTRDKDGALIRVQTLAVNMADLEYKVE